MNNKARNSAHAACTTVLVGKKASIDGTVMVARNEDFHEAISPKIFVLEKAVHESGRIYKSLNTGVKIPLPEKAYRYTSVPQAYPHDKENNGVYGEAGINEKNIAVSSTESIYGNSRVLAYDPLVKTGIAEDAINDIVLPYINSAREGVDFLGKLIAEYGSAEGNGIIFADVNEIWYMEIPCGHHWAAVRIPDDCYAVAPNQTSIEAVDFADTNNYAYSDGIQEFVETHHLNPDRAGFNFRHIFGTSSEQDRVYNTPRAWFAQKYLNPEIEQSPTSNDIPFIQKASRLISVEDVEYILSSHYNETEFDPLGNGNTEFEKTRFRCISLSRTAESHILQLRPNVPEGVAGIQWLALGTTAFVPYVPFFTNVLDTPLAYKRMTKRVSVDNAYWLFKLVAHFVELHYSTFKKENNAYLIEMQSYGRRRVKEITDASSKMPAKEMSEFLTEENKKTAEYVLSKTKDYLSDLIKDSFGYSKLSFTMDKNL
ncbi:C69 family dipeptidase [Treponema phagedenis]|uniref:C69 family dipeptidase n=1 Tax=Treponema phagedenis TaxID=162 RepID=UPI0001F64020|nr:C69 family dipeptidase [Treponema phagedenis]EFW37029.1 peptidase, C69 family [Treponema phagedenis F0421]TYT78658.1 C69 family dipeptidase [Treponema phagedenis]